MSDPMTRTEIEDVLSSIRRLVSEEARPHPQRVVPSQPAARSAARSEGKGAVVGRLVLTPALRVATPAPAAAGKAPVADAPVTDGAVTDTPETDTPVAESAADWQPELGNGASGEEWQPELVAAPAAARDDWQPEAEAPAVTPFEALSGGPVQTPVAPEAAAKPKLFPALEATIAELEAAVAARGEEWEPDGSEEPAPGDLAGPVGRAAREMFVHVPYPAPEPLARPALRAASQPVSELAQPESVPAAEAGAAPDAGAGEEELDSFELDEEALCELVRDIIRQELQGPLGERITRNVRKLVRTEISRALATRDFD